MSDNKLKEKSTIIISREPQEPMLPVVKMKPKVKVIVSDRVMNQIRYLCHRIHKVEWSGILFYTFKGEIEDPKNLVCTLENIVPMDVGSSASTDYDFDTKVPDYIMKDPIVRYEHKIGHIHSHHNMKTYFSGVDMHELSLNSKQHNFYLSFIVNNRMDFVCKIGVRAEVGNTVENYSAKGTKGKPYYIGYEKKDVAKLFVFETVIERKLDFRIGNSFEEEVNTIVNASIEKERKRKKKCDDIIAAKKFKKYMSQNSTSVSDWPSVKKEEDVFLDNMWENSFLDDDPISRSLEFAEGDIDDFVFELLIKEDLSELPDDLDQFLNEFATQIEDWEMLASEIVEIYSDIFEQEFGTDINDESFLKLLGDVINIFETRLEEGYSSIIATALRDFGNNYANSKPLI